MIISFDSFDLPVSLKNRLKEIGYDKPTEIQALTIPLILDKKDVLASSKTGSGKTGAFAIPMIARIVRDDICVLILAPTRELAVQIKDAIHNLRGAERVNTALILGGSDMSRQIDGLKKNPNVVIATPGRLADHIKRRTINLSKFSMLILDEFDRMLDIGFKEEISMIISKLPEEKQTIMFSATTRQSVKNLAKEYMVDHSEVILESAKDDHKNIQQEFLQIGHSLKHKTLLESIEKHAGSVIVFVATKRMADELAGRLEEDGHMAIAIHGDLRQRERERVIKDFRAEKYRILVATDVAARGLDVPHVKVIINYDMPKSLEDYTHRIGRTGRADALGVSISFVTPIDRKIYHAITMKHDSDKFESEPHRSRSPNRGSGDRGRSFGRSDSGEGGDRYPRGERRNYTGEGGGERRNYRGDSGGEGGGDRGGYKGHRGGGNGEKRFDGGARRPRKSF